MNSISQLGRLLKGLPRGVFDRLVEKHDANKYSKGFGAWQHLTAMVYAQLSGFTSLRQVEIGFNAHINQHYHLNARLIKKSTLAEANQKRQYKLFEDVANYLMRSASKSVQTEMKELLYLLDSSPIHLSGLGYDDWTTDNWSTRTQGLKLHILYEANSHVPVWQSITAPNVNDITPAEALDLQSNARYVFDKGYCDYAWWYQINQARSIFVTRAKKNASLEVVNVLPCNGTGVLSDEHVKFKRIHQGKGRKNPYIETLRRITIDRPDHDTSLVLLTNDLSSPAEYIGENYKARWGIELFFKWIKQNLKIKKFLGRSENSVKIQILTALITYLLVAMMHNKTKSTIKLSEFLTQLKSALFLRLSAYEGTYRRQKERRLFVEKHQMALL